MYWRRRLVALALGLSVLAVIAWAFNGAIGGAAPSGASAASGSGAGYGLGPAGPGPVQGGAGARGAGAGQQQDLGGGSGGHGAVAAGGSSASPRATPGRPPARDPARPARGRRHARRLPARRRGAEPDQRPAGLRARRAAAVHRRCRRHRPPDLHVQRRRQPHRADHPVRLASGSGARPTACRAPADWSPTCSAGCRRCCPSRGTGSHPRRAAGPSPPGAGRHLHRHGRRRLARATPSPSAST